MARVHYIQALVHSDDRAQGGILNEVAYMDLKWNVCKGKEKYIREWRRN